MSWGYFDSSVIFRAHKPHSRFHTFFVTDKVTDASEVKDCQTVLDPDPAFRKLLLRSATWTDDII